MQRTLIIFGLMLFSSLARAEEQRPGLETNINSITTVGNWKQGSLEGDYRFILYQQGFEHVRGELWLQWLGWEQDSNGIYTKKIVVAESPISEINQLGFSLESPECKENWKCPYFEIKAYSTFEGVANKKFKLSPTEPGKYELEEFAL